MGPLQKKVVFRSGVTTNVALVISFHFQIDEVVCQGVLMDTLPLDARCIGIQGSLPVSVKCGTDGIFCENSPFFNCSDMEISFLCARSRSKYPLDYLYL